MYKPNPICTDDVELSADILELSELIAKNTHDVWAVGRIADGWSYGKERDDVEKHHPCLISYEDLPESEKEYDRVVSREVLRLIVKLGYEIKKTEE